MLMAQTHKEVNTAAKRMNSFVMKPSVPSRVVAVLLLEVTACSCVKARTNDRRFAALKPKFGGKKWRGYKTRWAATAAVGLLVYRFFPYSSKLDEASVNTACHQCELAFTQGECIHWRLKTFN